MVLHAASMAAVFVDQVALAPVVVQCAPNAPDSWLKWLLPTIVQMVVSLLSIFAGVGIAVRSFRANKRTEHEQWVRDKKMSEWSTLMHRLTEAYQYFSHYSPEGKIQRLIENEMTILRILDEASMSFVFIAEKLVVMNYFPLLQRFQGKVEGCCREIEKIKDAYRVSPALSNECSLDNRIEFVFYPLEKEFFDLLVKTRQLAEADLDIKLKGEPDQYDSCLDGKESYVNE